MLDVFATHWKVISILTAVAVYSIPLPWVYAKLNGEERDFRKPCALLGIHSVLWMILNAVLIYCYDVPDDVMSAYRSELGLLAIEWLTIWLMLRHPRDEVREP